MDLKARIKGLGIRLLDISKELDISRPTLDTYISLYESGETLPHDKYQIIFERLFDERVKTKEDFFDVLDGYHNLIEKEKILGIKNLNAKESDLIGNIIYLIRDDVKSEEYDEDIYVFINMMLGSYKKVSTFSRVAKYFLLLNNSKSIEELDSYSNSEKAFYSNLYEVMKQDIIGQNKYDEIKFNRFRDRILELKEEKSLKTASIAEEAVEANLKKAFEERIGQVLNEKIRLGIDLDDIDMNEVIRSIDIKDLI
ncbi:MAG: hypothetical protein AB7V48_00555 [Sedimentibacter sp.]